MIMLFTFKETSLTESELLEIYEKFPKFLLKYSTKVTINENSLGRPNQELILLNQANNGNYWLLATTDVNSYYLLPKNNLKINPHEQPTAEALFDLKNYHKETTRNFTLEKLAKASLSANGQSWTLIEKGILEFSQTSLVSLEAKLQEKCEQYQLIEEELNNLRFSSEKANQENQRLQSKLSQSEEEGKQLLSILSNLKYSERERQQFLVNLEKLANTYQESFAQLANWGNFLNHTQQVLQERELLQSKVYELNQIISSFKSRIDEINLHVNSTNQSKSPNRVIESNTSSSHTISSNEYISEKYSLDDMVDIYNQNPDYFLQNSFEVSETKASFENRRAGYNQPPILTKSDRNRGIGWITCFNNSHYLVPRAKLKINQPNYKILEGFFNCQNYDPEYQTDKFTLIKAARVSFDGEDWQLLEKGELRFY